MQIRTIQFPHALRVGDMILMENHGITLRIVKEFLQDNDYPAVKLAEYTNEACVDIVKLKTMHNSEHYFLIVPIPPFGGYVKGSG